MVFIRLKTKKVLKKKVDSLSPFVWVKVFKFGCLYFFVIHNSAQQNELLQVHVHSIIDR